MRLGSISERPPSRSRTSRRRAPPTSSPRHCTHSSRAYGDIEDQITTRDYASLAQTRVAGEAALADALAAAESLGATDCAGIGVRIGYFAIAADGAEAAAARIAPTGDYVTDVNAACARFAEDTFGDAEAEPAVPPR